MMDDIRPVTMSAKEAALYLGISKWLILELVKRKEVPAIHAGKRVLFRKEILDIWMHGQEVNSVKKIETQNTGYGTIRRVKE